MSAWLDRLGSAAPAPGGGAAAAMNTAIGAALVAMVANLTIGKPAYAEHESDAAQVLARADAVRAHALALADRDADAFTALMATYRLPRTTDAEKSARTTSIQDALVIAAQVSLDIGAAAAEVIQLARSLHGRSNPSVVSDVAVAAASAAAGLESAHVNAEINARTVRDGAVKERLTTAIAEQAPLVDAARTLVADIRRDIGR
jgi:formiminotetrahydrofolate cyclodeaminase